VRLHPKLKAPVYSCKEKMGVETTSLFSGFLSIGKKGCQKLTKIVGIDLDLGQFKLICGLVFYIQYLRLGALWYISFSTVVYHSS